MKIIRKFCRNLLLHPHNINFTEQIIRIDTLNLRNRPILLSIDQILIAHKHLLILDIVVFHLL